MFKVGDRVVVVKNKLGGPDTFIGQRGEVVEIDPAEGLSVQVKTPSYGQAGFFPEELEFEETYDALSAPHPDEDSLFSQEVDTRHDDVVSHPSHYTSHPSGVECIEITEHMDFLTGNIFKYLWRKDSKHETPLEDLKKARFYLDRLISKEEKRAGLEH